MKINLYEMFCTDTLRHRETALEVLKELSNKDDEEIIIDFTNIKFASRSFCHELMSGVRYRKNVQLKQIGPEVQLMIHALDKPKLTLNLPIEA